MYLIIQVHILFLLGQPGAGKDNFNEKFSPRNY